MDFFLRHISIILLGFSAFTTKNNVKSTFHWSRLKHIKKMLYLAFSNNDQY